MMDIGVQLFTIREYLSDPETAANAVKTLKAMGYTSAQLYGSKTVFSAAAQACRDAGMPISGILSELEPLKRYGESVFDICKEFDIPDVGISATITEDMDVEGFIKDVNEYAAIVRSHGLSFSYHNHHREFYKTADGKTVMTRFLEGFDKALVDFMPDTYWLQVGGADVRHFLEQTKDRVQLLHLKDLIYTPEGPVFAEVGEGNLWFEGIFQTAQEVGIRRFVVEQDKCSRDPLESLRISIKNIKKMLSL